MIDLRDKLKNALKCPHESTAILKVHAVLDKLYMELLPLATATPGARKGLLPDPAAYLACALHALNQEKYECSTTLVNQENRILAYLQLRQMEAEHFDLPNVFYDVVSREGLSAMNDDHTMRGTCPVGTPTLRQWQDSTRDRVCHWSAFACPDEEALALIVKFCEVTQAGSVVELGAGTGYWALLGKQIKTLWLRVTDIQPPRGRGMEDRKRMNDYHGCFPPWTHVEFLASEKASAINCDVLLLVYPHHLILWHLMPSALRKLLILCT